MSGILSLGGLLEESPDFGKRQSFLQTRATHQFCDLQGWRQKGRFVFRIPIGLLESSFRI